MRLWHQFLVPYLDRQRLLAQHREVAALRGKGWGRPHSTVNYVFDHDPAYLVLYHHSVMAEMLKRGYHIDKNWVNENYRGKALGVVDNWCSEALMEELYNNNSLSGMPIYPEHNPAYFNECVQLLKDKAAPIDFDKIATDFAEYITAPN